MATQRTVLSLVQTPLNCQIRLQIKRTVPRHLTKLNFSDRNVDDVTDGYVSCDSYKDNREWKHVEKMERGMRAVPILVNFFFSSTKISWTVLKLLIN